MTGGVGLLEIDHIRGHVDILAHCYAQVEWSTAASEAKFLFNEALAVDAERADRRPDCDYAEECAGGRREQPGAGERPSGAAGAFSAPAEAQRQQEKRYLYDTLYTCPALSREHEKGGAGGERVVRFSG